MTTTPGRRKHNACLFRLRENCPLRKLRKSKCHDVHSQPTPNGVHSHPTPNGGHWTGFNDQPSTSAGITDDSAISVIYGQQLSPIHSDCGAHRLHVNSDAMDTYPVVHPGPSIPALPAAPPSAMAPAASNACIGQRNPSEGPSDASMELDSSVDPETGERAME